MGYFKTQNSVKLLGADPITGIENYYVTVNSDGSINTVSNVTPQGIRFFKVTTMIVGDTATLIPASPQPTRQGMTISNLDISLTLFWGPDSSVTADRVVGTTSGAEIIAGARENFDLRADVYAIAPTGTSIMIKVVEAYT